jgi:hypothetical protein
MTLIHAWFSLSFGIEQIHALGSRFWPRRGFRPVAYRRVRRVDQRIAWANGTPVPEK